MKTDVIIIGAGAAGLMCAITAAQRGRKVIVLDHANKAGKKILMSGGGRCNFTNINASHEQYISHNPNFCKSALSRYTPWHFLELINKHNIPYHEKKLGQLFCDNKAKDILNMLLTECQKHSVKIQLNTEIINIEKNTSSFEIQSKKINYQCESLVIATGGLSIPTAGASPFGYKVATQFNINIKPTRAGLVPFTLHNEAKTRFAELSGISVPCDVTCNKHSFKEDMLFSHRGLTGPAMLQISSYWHPGDSLTISLNPDIDLYSMLTQAKINHPNKAVKTILNEKYPKRLVSTWLENIADKNLQQLNNKQLQEIANRFQQWQLKPNNTEGYRTAEVTIGGIDCDNISSKTFESKTTNGLFFVGEVIDVTGWLGGYNFQWAWASGFAAGCYV